ncbi:AfsA-related hotdog domain-containing protein [Azotobacter vinelandii]|uniref:AfsA-related hotdog domain-containing protein n=1 Tax=Azotobacter vinelandii TaxID=354 RepID=UPI0007745B32|nr:AfsA-related hotdog domain-containing protein [Azotobacter vinelandii]
MNNDTISPDILHKGSADDVLICAPKVALPLYLTETTIQSSTHSPVLRSYVSCANQRSKFDISPDLQGKIQMDGAFASGAKADDGWSKVRALPYQIVAPHLLKEIETAGLRGDSPEHAVAELCNSIPAIQRSSSFQFINNADNYFFYRKAHEHVPGMMFIEAARQAVYHHLYHHTNHARGEVTVSVNELNASFFAYAELMYPIELVVDNISPTDTSSPKKIHFRVAFYQRQTLFATIDTKATVIAIRLFEKTRNIFIFSDDWFAPIKQSKLVCTISDKQERKSDVMLMGLGKNGCVTTTPDTYLIDPVALHILYEGKLSFSGNILGGRQGKYSIWEFPDIDFNELQNMSDMIKRGFVHLDEATLGALKE